MNYINEHFDITVELSLDKTKTRKLIAKAIELYCLNQGHNLTMLKAKQTEFVYRYIDETMCVSLVFSDEIQDYIEDGWLQFPKSVRHSIPTLSRRIHAHFEKLMSTTDKYKYWPSNAVRIKSLDGSGNDPEYYSSLIDDPMDYDLLIKPHILETN